MSESAESAIVLATGAFLKIENELVSPPRGKEQHGYRVCTVHPDGRDIVESAEISEIILSAKIRSKRSV